MTRPAKFRETLASVNTFLNAPQLDLGDIEPAVFSIANVSGVIIHGPSGRKMEEDDQNLGFLNFAVPHDSYLTWGINVPVAEITARFESWDRGSEVPQRDIAVPLIKRPKKKSEDGDSV